MSKEFEVFITDGRRKVCYGYCNSQADVDDLARFIYNLHPRRYDRHVEVVNRKTGEVTVL